MLCLVGQSCLTLCNPMDCSPPGTSVHGDSPGKNTAVGCPAFLQGKFPTQGLNPGLPHCRWILYHQSHQGSPRLLKWVACPFSKGTSLPRNQTGVSFIASRFFTSWATLEAYVLKTVHTLSLLSFFFSFFNYLARSGFSCSTQGLCCLRWGLSLRYTDSLVVVQGLSSCGSVAQLHVGS